MTVKGSSASQAANRPSPIEREGFEPRRMSIRLGDDKVWRWATLAPALVAMLALSVLPLANLFATSFLHVTWARGQAVRSLVGLANYAALPADPLFRAGLVNTIVFAVAAVGAEMV